MTTYEPQSSLHGRRCAAGSGRRCSMAIRTCLTLLAVIGGVMCLAGGLGAQVRLPDFGDASEQTLSPADERALGEAVHARDPVPADPRRRSPGRAIRSIARVPARRIVRSPRPRVHVLRGRRRIAERVRGTGRLRRRQLRADNLNAVRERVRVRPGSRDRARHSTPHRPSHRTCQPLEPSGTGRDPRSYHRRHPGRRGRPGDGSRGDRNDGAETDQLHPAERDGSRPGRYPDARRRRGSIPARWRESSRSCRTLHAILSAPPSFSPRTPSLRIASRRLGTAPSGSRTNSTRARSRTTSSAPSCECASPAIHNVYSTSSSRSLLPATPRAPPRTPMGKRSRSPGSAVRTTRARCSNAWSNHTRAT